MTSNDERAAAALKQRLEPGDDLVWHGAISLGGKSRHFVISSKWIVLFKSINQLEKPVLWLPREMVQQVSFTPYRDTAAGQLQIRSTGGDWLDFGYFSDFQSLGMLNSLDKNEAANYLAKIEAKGNLIGRLRGKSFVGGEMVIYENQIFGPVSAMDLDENTVAEVMLEGQKVVTARPTLTRMAALSFLPGTALIPGLALQKKTVKDDRQLIIVVANAKSNISFELAVDQLAPAKAMANQINAIAESKHRANQSGLREVVAIQPAAPEASIVQQIKDLKQLLEDGAISPAEFETLKAKVIGS